MTGTASRPCRKPGGGVGVFRGSVPVSSVEATLHDKKPRRLKAAVQNFSLSGTRRRFGAKARRATSRRGENGSASRSRKDAGVRRPRAERVQLWDALGKANHGQRSAVVRGVGGEGRTDRPGSWGVGWGAVGLFRERPCRGGHRTSYPRPDSQNAQLPEWALTQNGDSS